MNLRDRLRSFISFVSFVSLFLLSSPVGFAQKTLAWKFSKGMVLDVAIDQDTNMKLSGQGAGKLPLTETNTMQKTNLAWAVLDVQPDGLASIEQSIGRVVLEMKSPKENFIIDTQDNRPLSGMAETMAREIRPLAGARFIAKTKATGEIVDLVVPSDSLKTASASAASLAEAGLREIAVNSSLRLPSKPINVGETWQNEYELDMRIFGKLIVSTTYQYLGEETQSGKTLDKIKATTAKRSAETKANSGLKLSKQESSGTIWFDNVRGIIDHCEFQQVMAIDVLQAGQQIKNEVKQDLKLKFSTR
jgi:hypothetical protein